MASRCCFHLALSFSFIGANLTEKIRKIKIVFTPTICKQTCRSGRCYNSCEKGDTTTLYSQGGHDHDPKSGFRICEHPEAPAHLLSCSPTLPLLPFLPLRTEGLGCCRNGKRWPLSALEDVSWGHWGLLHLSLGEEDRPCLIALFSWASHFCFHDTPDRGGLSQACGQASPPPPSQSQLAAFVGIQSWG